MSRKPQRRGANTPQLLSSPSNPQEGFEFSLDPELVPSKDAVTRSTADFRPPCLVRRRSQHASGAESHSCLLVVPTSPGRCRQIACQVRSREFCHGHKSSVQAISLSASLIPRRPRNRPSIYGCRDRRVTTCVRGHKKARPGIPPARPG